MHNEKSEHIPTLAETQYTDMQSQAGWVNKYGETKTAILFHYITNKCMCFVLGWKEPDHHHKRLVADGESCDNH